MNASEQASNRERAALEVAVLKQYGLRWAVLAGWRDALKLRQVQVAPESDRLLEEARVKIATGCFSVCDVGCDLSQIEGILTSADASTDHNWVDFWIDLLANSMRENAETERILKVPAVKARYTNCGLSVCRC